MLCSPHKKLTTLLLRFDFLCLQIRTDQYPHAADKNSRAGKETYVEAAHRIFLAICVTAHILQHEASPTRKL